jgi:hypothetical protein
MGKIKEAVIEGEVFACEHFNIPEMEFIYKAQAEFGKGTIEYEAAINEWYEIQQDLFEMYTERTVH